MNAHNHETACIVARAAAWELDESKRWLAFDPERHERAKARAVEAFAALVVATREALP
jgi:hypothetical protein